jgi:hypothetical protein
MFSDIEGGIQRRFRPGKHSRRSHQGSWENKKFDNGRIRMELRLSGGQQIPDNRY